MQTCPILTSRCSVGRLPIQVHLEEIRQREDVAVFNLAVLVELLIERPLLIGEKTRLVCCLDVGVRDLPVGIETFLAVVDQDTRCETRRVLSALRRPIGDPLDQEV